MKDKLIPLPDNGSNICQNFAKFKTFAHDMINFIYLLNKVIILRIFSRLTC